MPTKSVDITQPGQAYVYLEDLARERSTMTPLQFSAFVGALFLEWRTGVEPTADQWRRLVAVPNGSKRKEIEDLADGYAANPLRKDLLHIRERSLAERRAKVRGQAARTDRKTGQHAAGTVSESASASASESASVKDNSNVLNEDARKVAAELRLSSCLPDLSTDVDKSNSGGDARMHAHEAATGNSRLGGTSAEDTDSPNGGTLPAQVLQGPNDDFFTSQEQLRAQLEAIVRQMTKSVGVNAGNVEKLVKQDVSGLVEAQATPELLRQFYGQRQRIPSLGYTTSDYLKWVVNTEKGAGNVNNGTSNNSKRQTASERAEQRLVERDYAAFDQAVSGGAHS